MMGSMAKQQAFLACAGAIALFALGGCGPSDDGDGGAAGTSGNGGGSGSSGSSGFGGSSGNSGSGGSGGGQPSGRILWTVTDAVPALIGIDTGSHQVVLDVDVYGENNDFPQSLAASKDHVFLGRDDGFLVVVDRKAKALVAEIDTAPYADGNDTDIDIYNIAVGDGAAFTFPESTIQPPLLRVDAASLEVTKQADILHLVGYPTSISFDGKDLWITEWNSFELLRVDAATLEERGRVALGEHPDDPNVLGEFYGHGYGADTGDTVWIIDTEASRLLAVDKATLTPRIVSDLSDLTDFETALQFEGNAKGAFLLLDEPGIIVRFDPKTGERVHTYDFSNDGGVGMFALASDKLYVTPGGSSFVYDIRELDIETGAVVQTIHSLASVNRIGIDK
jgi:hypothetical protein